MDYKRAVERHLNNYKFIKVSIDNMKSVLATELEPRGLSAISYDRDIVQANSTESSVECEAVYLADKKRYLEQEIRQSELLIQVIDRCLQALPNRHRKIVTLRYMGERMSWNEISEEMKYSVTHCKRIHGGALYRMSIGMYGMDATRPKPK